MNANDVQLGGLLGEALDANRRGRLSRFISDESSPAIVLFSPELRQHNVEGDWYGEHAGKWLLAAARAAARSGDENLRRNVLRVADYLVAVQEDDGYLGTYAPGRRFTDPQPPKSRSWDGAPGMRTWDVWTHSYLVLGLLEVQRRFPSPKYLQAAQRIGDLCWRTFVQQGVDITRLGNHHGLSATVLLDPALELFRETGEPRYLELAQHLLTQAESHRESAIVSAALGGSDASEISTGKAYQLLWNLVGIAKLHQATGNASYRAAVEALWENVRRHHLSLGGGPWGGVAHRSREVFNPAGVFVPTAYVETCSILAWMQLNRQLFELSGDARYAEEVERSAYNDLLGAQAPDGEDWCYYSYPNGRRVHTTYWRCCKSSGAMAMEELPLIAFTVAPDGAVSANLLGPARFVFQHPGAGRVVVDEETRYPYDGRITFRVTTEHQVPVRLRVRIPSWAREATAGVAGGPLLAEPGKYCVIERLWRAGDELLVDLPMQPRTHAACHGNVQESRAPDGSLVRQEVLRHDYLALSRGPLVYATSLIDGFKTDESLSLPALPAQEWLEELPPLPGDCAPRLVLEPDRREPIVFLPYFMAGGRIDGAWRLTWMSLAPGSPKGESSTTTP